MTVSTGAPALARLLDGWQQAGHGLIHERLSACLASLILDGRLTVNTRLPSERELAVALHVSRSTVTGAYARLREDGLLVSRRGAGSWTTVPTRINRNVGPITPNLRAAPDLLDLAIAVAEPATDAVLEAVTAAAALLPAQLRGADGGNAHGYHPAGISCLREAVARRYVQRGADTRAGQILAAAGSQGAIHLVTRSLVGPGDTVMVEQPSYPNAIDALRRTGARLIGVPVTPQGWDMDHVVRTMAQARPKLAYFIPDFHNPTGAVMSAAERVRLVAAAQRYGTILLIDETNSELALDGQTAPPPIAALDPGDNVVSVGSLSKVFWGGLRVGWLRTSEARVAELATSRSSVDLAGPVLEQLAAAHLLQRVEQLLPRRRREFRRRRDALLDALGDLVPHWRWTAPPGGLSVWVTLDRPVSTALADAAEQYAVRLVPGPRFGLDGTLERYLRLPFSLPARQLTDAVTRIAKAEGDLHRP
ncbi:PLP-dependent aminotransferase family protein [Microbispora sp. RL4-1S]|uniref:PLP-dependent aminotransferase family protein n=1 Tax=Microbispora oryzae TaxID=2806554 RepID=A0A941AJ28_9ACTN|nr:PLP-dependent aminotransferase family protein [Microbispora oryzae]MBP2705865.1 PLP-dependent aminotransferase family protein [Microbispora oryzae]